MWWLFLIVCVIVLALLLPRGGITGGAYKPRKRCVFDIVEPPDYNSIHVMADEQNLMHGEADPAAAATQLHQELKKKYSQYARVVMHLVTKVPSRTRVYRSVYTQPDTYLYVALRPEGPHSSGYDDLATLILATAYHMRRHDVTILSRDKYRDADEFMHIPPFDIVQFGLPNGGRASAKLIPAEWRPRLPLLKKLNAGYHTKMSTLTTWGAPHTR
jgi:hypothetical protein